MGLKEKKISSSLFRKVPVVLQGEISECGLACLCMICSFYGYHQELNDLRNKMSVSLSGLTLLDLSEMAEGLGLISRGISLDVYEITKLKLPCILHWDFNHFVVLTGCSRNGIKIIDPAIGKRFVEWETTSDLFTGVALELKPEVNFKQAKKISKLGIRDILKETSDINVFWLKVLLLAVSIEICAILSPFFMQWIVDEAIINNDRQFILTLSLAFAVIWVGQSLIELLTSWVVAHMGASINIQWLKSIGKKLFSLPERYFSNRHTGDILSRVNTINVIQNTLTTSIVGAVVDAVISLFTVGMMFLYSAKLAVISVFALILYILSRVLSYEILRSANENQFVLDAKQQTFLLECIRGVRTIKLFCKESIRLNCWINKVIDYKNAYLRSQRVSMLSGAFSSFVFRMENILIVALGANLVIRKEFTIGMLMAYVAYRGQFSARATSLVNKFYEFKILDVQFNRLSDITKEKEETSSKNKRKVHLNSNDLLIRNVSYRYSRNSAYLFKNLNFSIKEGEHVAIVGKSGCGKTTLLKILAGFLSPSEGDILCGEMNLKDIGYKNYRLNLGVVMQDDQLFSGTIAENICFFDEKPDQDLIRKVSEIAAIKDEIEKMAMGFESMIGDMGAALSGGQKQRILLARALYKKPKILLLDEATSHLDCDGEKNLNENIKDLDITRIIIAHRPETINSADRVLKLDDFK